MVHGAVFYVERRFQEQIAPYTSPAGFVSCQSLTAFFTFFCFSIFSSSIKRSSLINFQNTHSGNLPLINIAPAWSNAVTTSGKALFSSPKNIITATAKNKTNANARTLTNIRHSSSTRGSTLQSLQTNQNRSRECYHRFFRHCLCFSVALIS